jgi:Calcineurin-like phosphoesterase
MAQALYLRVIKQRLMGMSYSQIAQSLNITKDKAQKLGRRAQYPPKATDNLPEEMVIRGDCLVLNDIHAPDVDWDLLDLAIKAGRRKKVEQVAIVGDLCNFDVISQYPHLWMTDPIQSELNSAKLVMSKLMRAFKYVYLCRGNHDARLMVKLNGGVDMAVLGDLIAPGPDRKRLKTTIRDRMWLSTPAGLWLLCHQHEFSRNRLVVAEKFAKKYQCHVLTTHQHGFAVGQSSDGRFAIVDAPCMCDMPVYAELNTTSMPNWAKGFTLILDGHAYPYVEDVPLF